MNGWFKIHRILLSKSIWKDSTPEQKSVLITLLGMADHKPNEWEWKGKSFKTVPGQMVTSHRSIAEKTGKGISKQNVRTALKRFKKYDFLTYQSTHSGLLITIINWVSYQSLENEPNTPTQQTANTPLTPNKNVRTKEVNNVEFEKFWNLYDKKVGSKVKCCKKFYSLKKSDHVRIFETLPKYKNSTPDKQFRKNPMTYLNNQSWNDEIIHSNVYDINHQLSGTRIKTDEEMSAK
jgi:hypothetical protein